MKCPMCGNEKKFICEVVAVAEYDSETNSFYKLSDVGVIKEFNYIQCKQCHHQAPADEFED